MSFINKLKELDTRKINKDLKKKEYFSIEPSKPNKSILLYITGVFSILFSMSTLSSIFIEGNYLMTSLIGVFLLIVLVANEKFKVDNLIKLGSTQKFMSSYVLISITTLIISLSSVYGIYTTIDRIELENKMYQTESTGSIHRVRIDSLSNILNLKLDSINNTANKSIYEQYIYYKDLADNTRIIYNSDRDKKEEHRNKASEYYSKLEASKKDLEKRLEENIKQEEVKFQLSKSKDTKTEGTSKVVKYIISSLALIVELIIIGLAFTLGKKIKVYEEKLDSWAKEKEEFIKKEEEDLYNSTNFNKFVTATKILKVIYSTKKIGDTISKKDLKDYTSLANVNYGDKELLDLRSLFISLKILTLQSNNSTVLNLDLEKSTTKLDELFSNLE